VTNLRLLLLFWGLFQLPLVFVVQDVSTQIDAAIAPGARRVLLRRLLPEESNEASVSCTGVLYAVYSVLLLQWIMPWAIVTVRDERWGTR